jgi:hypothetical protein
VEISIRRIAENEMSPTMPGSDLTDSKYASMIPSKTALAQRKPPMRSPLQKEL